MENRFIVIVPVYNAVNYIDGCIDSILCQRYDNFRLCIINDGSTDGTREKISRRHQPWNMDIVHLVHNGSALGNIATGIYQFALDPEDIIVVVDGDDSLVGDTVLSDLNEVYQDPGVYMTYGQFVPISSSYGPYCKPIPDTRTYRKGTEWLASHLRTYKKKLWDKIKFEDLRDKDFNFYKTCGDTAVLYPLIEMCGHKHMRFIEKVNYLYNDLNPSNDMKLRKEEQLRTEKEIKDKPCYQELP
jgi:glycosyltransferase involved in cell wall biosynthesis